MKIRFWRRIPAIPKTALLFFLILGGCEKDDSQPIGKGFALIKSNQLEFETGALLSPSSNKFNFIFVLKNEAGRVRIEMPIDNVPAEIGDHALARNDGKGNSYAYFFTMDADLGLDDYLLLEGGNNTVSLTEINSAEQTVRGTFQLTFVRDTLMSAIKKDIFPDTIRLTDGTFETPYEKK